MDRRGMLRYVSAAAIGAAAGVGIYGTWLEPRSLQLSRVRAPSRGGAGNAVLPPLRIALLTDLHLGAFTPFHRRIAGEVVRAAPHLVVLGGDSVDERRGLEALDTLLALLPGGTPLLGIMGNWEYWGGIAAADLRPILENHGGTLLVNATTTLEVGGRRLAVTGVDDSVAGEPDAELARRIAGEVVRAAPHLVVLGGDSVDERRGLEALDTLLALLPGGIPLLGIMGNWEYWGGIAAADLRPILENHGGALLVNETTTLEVGGRRLAVTGVDDSVAGEPDAALARRPVEEGVDHLILAHCPVFRDELRGSTPGPDRNGERSAARPPVILSGHTHGGQVALPGRPFTPPGSGRYAEGWYTDPGAPPMYVSRGLGTSLVRLRIGCRPELPIVEL